jgi:hypothetical protein
LSHPLSELPRIWPSVELPGYREHPTDYATYSGFAFDELPPIGRTLDDDLGWLVSEPAVGASLVEVNDDAARPATNEQLGLLLAGETVTLPPSFSTFIESTEPRRRIRSCTDCYLDLADFAVPVSGGGTLIHFLSDSQWVFHWLLYAGSDSSEAVVVTDVPLGFEEGSNSETVHVFEAQAGGAAVCAESFLTFIFRFWIENEMWFKLTDPGSEPRLTDEQRRYAEHYSQG